MMYKFSIFSLFTLLSIFAYAQDRESVEIGDFDEIRASGNLDVNLKKGAQVFAEFSTQGIDEDMVVIEN